MHEKIIVDKEKLKNKLSSIVFNEIRRQGIEELTEHMNYNYPNERGFIYTDTDSIRCVLK